MNKKIISMLGVVLLIICSSAVCLSFGRENSFWGNVRENNIAEKALEEIEDRTLDINNLGAMRLNFNNIIKSNETTTYTVKHYKMKLDGETYADPEIETKEGLADTLVSPETKEYEGFTSPKVQTVKVEADGSTVVEYRYERNKYKLELIAGTGITEVIGAGEFYYGQIVSINAKVADGYSFRNWIDSNNKACTDSTIKIKVSDKNMSFTANAKPDKGIVYTVKHYKMNIDGQTYADPYIETKTGKTDELVTPEVKIYKGFTSPETQTVKVNKDGTTVVEYHYTRNKYKLELIAGTGIAEVKGAGEYYYEQEVEISAKPSLGYEFKEWVYDIGRTCNEATVRVKIGTRNVMMVANANPQEQIKYTVKHYKMNINGTTYAEPEVETKTANANAKVTPEVKQYEGFTAPAVQTKTVNPDGSTVIEYKYTRNKYKLTLTKGEGIAEVKGSGEYYFESEVEIEAKVLKGYIFDSWKDEKGGISKNAKAKVKIGAKDSVVEAKAIKDKSLTYKITFDANGGKTETTEQKVEYGEKIAKPKDPTRTGYKFVGWYVNLTDKEAFDFNKATATQNITLHAKWEANKYTVKFDANGGTGKMADQQFTYDQEGTLNANSFTREGYTFAGWSETSKETVKYADKAKVKNLAASGTKTLYAVWTQNRKFTIIFNANNGTDAKTQQVIDYDKQAKLNKNTFTEEFTITYNYNNAEKKTETVKVSSKFLGWSLVKDGEVKYEDEGNVKAVDISKENSINLYAKWEKPTITLKKVEDTSEYKFLGWSTSDKKENIISGNNNYKVVGNTTLTAIWEQIVPQEAPKIESISFVVKDKEGKTHREEAKIGDEVFFVKFPEGYEIDLASIMIKTNTPVRLNKKAVSSKDYIDITADVYTEDGRTGNLQLLGFNALTVKSNDGITWQSTDEDLFVDLEMLNILLGEKNLGVAKGFAKTDDGQETPHYISKMEQFQTGDTYMYFYKEGTKDVKIEWKNGEKDSYTVNIPQGALLPEHVVKENENFEGWYTDAAYTKKFDFSKPVTSDIVLYAKYKEEKKETYTIKYDSNGGTTVAEQKVLKGDKITKPVDPTRKGYTFKGWYKDNNYKEEFKFDTPATQNLTLYAKWEANKYTVKFDANGGTGTMNDQQFTYDQEGNLNNNSFTREGYTFAGWGETKEDKTAKYTNGQKIKNLAESGNKTLYAVWTQNRKYTIIFNANNGTNNTTKQVIDYDKETKLNKNTFKEEFTVTYKNDKDNQQNNKTEKVSSTFLGWSTEKDGDVKYSDQANVKAVDMNNGDSINLYAKWKKPTITLKKLDDTAEYKLLGWSTANEKDKILNANTTYTVVGNVTLTALWEKIKKPDNPPVTPPDDPQQPDNPNDPNTPDNPSDNPSQPGTEPSDPNTPDNPSQPGTEPSNPSTPDNPSNPNDEPGTEPSNPSTPDNPSNPSEPGKDPSTEPSEPSEDPGYQGDDPGQSDDPNPPQTQPVEPRIVDISFEIKDKNQKVTRQKAVVCTDDVFYVCLPEGCSVNVASMNLQTNIPIKLNEKAKATKRTDISLKNCSEGGRKGSLSVMDMDIMTIQSTDGMSWTSDSKEESYFDLSLLKLALSMKPGASLGIVEGFGITEDDKKQTPRYDSAIKTDHAGNVYLYFYKKGTETVKVTWVNGNGEKIENTIPKGGKLPERIGVENAGFENWYKDEQHTQLFNFEEPITTDTVLYAKYNNSKKANAVAYAGVKMIGLFNQ